MKRLSLTRALSLQEAAQPEIVVWLKADMRAVLLEEAARRGGRIRIAEIVTTEEDATLSEEPLEILHLITMRADLHE
jgi:hypothetical protein